MGLLSWLKTSEKAVDTASDLVKKGADGIDALFFTAEEKSQASLKMIDLWIKTQEVIRDEGTARAITRRVLAIIIVGMSLFLGLAACAVYYFDKDLALFILSVVKEYGYMTTAVVIFYFGYYAVKQIVGEKK